MTPTSSRARAGALKERRGPGLLYNAGGFPSFGAAVSPNDFHDALILTGPTGSGKTQLSLALAERLDAEIVSMDSMALYRGLDIAAAKPGPAERARVPHHLLDMLAAWESASVAWWLEQAARCCADIRGRGRRVLFVGGTPLYLKALLRGLFDGPGADPAVRTRLEREAEALGRAALHNRLASVDPATAARLHPNDVRRVVRALEVWETTGRPISTWQQQWRLASGGCKPPESAFSGGSRPPLTKRHCLWLDRPREELYARIDARVHAMIAQGLVEEIAALRRLPLPVSREAAQAAGYREICAHLDGEISLEEAVHAIQLRSRRLAKRQRTWFRSLPECHPVNEALTFAEAGWTMTEGEDNSQLTASPPPAAMI
jgi:tRNA dimethylallyltransferase